ncbi:UNVERIFIED_CONTAM: hypothetical protein ABIC26_002701 [Paenibacillus sp. PvR008]
MWRKYENSDTVGYCRLINDDYTVWTENAEVVLLDKFTDGTQLLTKKTIKFTEYCGEDIEFGMDELRDEYKKNIGSAPKDLIDLAYYCVAGWSRWDADERIDNPTTEEINAFLLKHGIVDTL